MVKLGTSNRAPDGAPAPPLGSGFGPPEKPAFTDPGGAGTSNELAGFSPATTNEVSDGRAAAEVRAGAAGKGISAGIGCFAVGAGGVNLLRVGRAALTSTGNGLESAAAATAGASGSTVAGAFSGTGNLRAGGGVKARSGGRDGLTSMGRGFDSVTAATLGASGKAAGLAGAVGFGALGGVKARSGGRDGFTSMGRGRVSAAAATFGASGRVGAFSATGGLTGGGMKGRTSLGGGARATMLGKGSGSAGAISGACARINCAGRALSLGPATMFCSNLDRARGGRGSRLARAGATSGRRSLSLYQTIFFSLGWISRS